MTITIDGTIGKDYWGDDDTIISASKVRDQLKNAKPNEDITVEINSPGGSVMEGITIFNLFRDYTAGSINIKIVGLCASIATYISLSADKIEAYDNAVYMIHNVSSFAIGDHHEMRKVADTVEGLSSLIATKYAQKTKKTKKEIIALMNKESWYYGEELLSEGFVDTILTSTDDSTTNRSELLALAKESFATSMDIVRRSTKDEEYQEAVAFLNEANTPPRGNINALNYRLKQYQRRLDNYGKR